MTSRPTVQIAETVDQVIAMRDVWVAVQSHPEADLDFYLTLLNTRPEILRPHVITLNHNGNTQSILVGRIERVRLTVGVGYAKVLLPSVRCLTVVGAGLFGDRSDESVSALVSSVDRSLKNKEADVAWFHQLEAGSSLYRTVKEAGGFLRRDHFPSFNDHWSVRLPGTYEQFLRLRSSKTRQDLRRYTKRLQGLFGDQMSIRTFKHPREIDLLMADTEVVAGKTYHRGLNAGFIDNQETRQRMLLYANEGRLRTHILYVGEKPIAFWHGFLYGKTFYPWTTGYDPDYRDTHPGLFLLQKVFADLCEEKIAEAVDFGAGDAHYKRDWGDENRRDVSMFLFGPSCRGVFLNMLRTPLLACSEAARWGLNKTNLLQKTKRLWRSRLSSSASSRKHASSESSS